MSKLEGKVTDYGDFLKIVQYRNKGRHLRLIIRIGAPRDTAPGDRRNNTQFVTPAGVTGRTDVAMDLQADKQVPLSVEYTDEVGNPVGAPAGASVTYTLADPAEAAVINLTDNGDGTGMAAATGTLGTANVHVEANLGDGSAPVTGDLNIVVVAGLAERINIVAGAPEEVTP